MIAIFLILWGAVTLSLGIFRFEILWNMAKVRLFVSHLGECGSRVLFCAVGLAAILAGVLLLV